MVARSLFLKCWLLRDVLLHTPSALAANGSILSLSNASNTFSGANRPNQHYSDFSQFLILYKLEIALALFVVVSAITVCLFVLDRRFRTVVTQKLTTNLDVSNLASNQRLIHQISIARVAFILGLICLFFFVLFTYQHYENQKLVMLFATGIFLLNVVGSYLFGSLKKTKQTEHLVNKLHFNIISQQEAQEKLLASERRLQLQNASLASLAAMQLNRETHPKVFLRQLIRQSAETLNVARVSVWMYSEDKQTLECEALYELSSQNYTHGQQLTANDYPAYFKALNEERVIAADDAYTHTMTSEFVSDYLPANNIAAMLDATIWQDDEILGVLCHEHLDHSRAWTLDEKNYVGSLADLLRLTIEASRRRKAEESLLQYNQELEVMVQARTQSLQESEKRFSTLLHYAPIPICSINLDGEIIEFNPESEKVTGYTKAQVIGRNFIELLVEADSLRLASKIGLNAERGRDTRDVELLFRCADGSKVEFLCSIVSAPYANGGKQMIAVAQNLTQQKALQVGLIRAREAAESADRIKSMFVASMSHELRTPLNSIIGFLGVVLQGLSGSITEKQKDQLGRAYASSKHLLSLISDVIDISKIEAGYLEVHAEKLNLSHLLDDIYQAVTHLRQDKNLVLTIDCPKDLEIESDYKRLYQVILNVVSNGIKYTEKGEVHVQVNQLKNDIQIKVKDTGIGIGESDISKLFKPFERIDSPLKIKTLGTGLGLYLTNKILSMLLGGKIQVKSKLHAGSTFTITVPIVMPKRTTEQAVNILED